MYSENHPTDVPPARAYMRTQIETASHQRLICMLHEQCACTLRQAIKVDTPNRRTLLNRVQNIIVILQRALKITDATAKGLFHLYDYCYCLCEQNGTTELTHALSVIDGLQHTFDRLQKRPG